ncbi:hypothetical protein [Clostridium baratii]|nr:hypothetical protein [Clostridium baratii]
MDKEKNNILQGDYKRIIIETDKNNPITIATISNDSVILGDGYRIRLLPR